ncbi:HAD-superfamily subfamily IIID h [Coemansia reversa NRRL 1564]|uniref:protein-serine/threonine phosphatase n=1 Tax=Coemansia reversa (strain ATCC 12441 / NRRL 1564) TaxID=763665 RepID=A0A2G5BII2_COERN|nr:HAD-superfamily subfamily IIID h [Coemansia reversa NRRL 1564]|eukprot:PIA18791.1 HAD-superfamily subfamily IIID h [Coemansia reversa NRRL 1564]
MLPVKRCHAECCEGTDDSTGADIKTANNTTVVRKQKQETTESSNTASYNEPSDNTETLDHINTLDCTESASEDVLDKEHGEDEMARESLSLEVIWKGSERYSLKVTKYATVISIKVLLEELTEVDSDSQKLLGLVKGKLPRDTDTLAALGVKSGTKVRLVGTRVADQLKPREDSWHDLDSDVPAISDDVDTNIVDSLLSGGREHQVVSTDSRQKLDKIIREAEVRVMSPPRPGRKLVVLDLDYTLFDCKNMSGNVVEMARPGLHEFLSAIYPYYDLIVWSQTKWHVVECKITLLGMVTHPNYKITTALDISAMFNIKSIRNGKPVDHQVKALEFIWARFPDVYDRSNTIHVDDLGRNFALNRQNGLKIRPYKRADTSVRNDTELYRLTRYLLSIAKLPTLEFLDHSQWHSYR